MTLEKNWRGRDAFRRLRPFLMALTTGLGVLPAAARRWLLVRLRRVDGYAAMSVRWALVRTLAAGCGDNVAIYADVHLHNPSRLDFGNNIKIGEMSFLGAAGGIRIEDDVSIAHGCSLLTEYHDLSAEGPLRDTPLRVAPITLKRGCLIGAGSRVLGGVTIGEGAMVGAGSVVTSDVPDHAVVAGVPTRIIRVRPPQSAG